MKRVVVGLAAATEEAQQVEEQVDEVQVQCQCTYDADFHEEAAIVLNFGIGGKALDLLGIIGSEYGEEDDAAHADEEIKTAATQEHIDQTGYKQADETHVQVGTIFREVKLGGVAEYGHGCEGACCREEGKLDGTDRVDRENDGQGYAVQDGIGEEHDGCREGREFLQEEAETNDQR